MPSVEEVASLLQRAADELPLRQVWVNPDCGLKTRGYDETVASLRNLVTATQEVRARVAVAGFECSQSVDDSAKGPGAAASGPFAASAAAACSESPNAASEAPTARWAAASVETPNASPGRRWRSSVSHQVRDATTVTSTHVTAREGTQENQPEQRQCRDEGSHERPTRVEPRPPCARVDACHASARRTRALIDANAARRVVAARDLLCAHARTASTSPTRATTFAVWAMPSEIAAYTTPSPDGEIPACQNLNNMLGSNYRLK